MPKGSEHMTSIEMRTLILEALSIEDKNNTPRKQTFIMYGYKGCMSDLKAIVEYLAIKYNLLDDPVQITPSAWGAPDENPCYKRNTNFDEDELNLFTEEFYFLIFQNVISPGAAGNYGDNLPYFHVTQYGCSCLMAQDVLPYDPESYLSKLRNITSIDAWELFYVEQCLKCYNIGAMESSIIMIGLAGEYLAIQLIVAMDSFLGKNETAIQTQFKNELSGKIMISQRYAVYENILKAVLKKKDTAGNEKYPSLTALNPTLDGAAKAIYATFLRLTRNELAHPAAIRMSKIECLTMLVSFIKYCQTQHNYLDFYISNS